MKFACERCGKRFASVDEPAPGRVYRIRCRCGNIIHISAPPPNAPASGARSGAHAPADPLSITGATRVPAIPPVSPRPGKTAGAGDSTSRRQAGQPSPSVLIPDAPAAPPTEPDAARPAAAPAGDSHSLATPLSALGGARASEVPDLFDGIPELSEPTPARTKAPPLQPPASTTGAAPWPSPMDPSVPRPRLEPMPEPLEPLASDISVPEDDPFAVAAARSERLDTPPIARRATLSAVAERDDAPIEMPVSEQVPIARSRRRRVSSAVIAVAVAAVAFVVGAAAFLWYQESGASARGQVTAGPSMPLVPLPVPPPAMPLSPPEPPPAAAPAAVAGAPAAAPAVADAVPAPVAAPAPPAVAAPGQAAPPVAAALAPPEPARAEPAPPAKAEAAPRSRRAAAAARPERKPRPERAPGPPRTSERKVAAAPADTAPAGGDAAARPPPKAEPARAPPPEPPRAAAHPPSPPAAPPAPPPAPVPEARREEPPPKKAGEGLDQAVVRGIIARSRPALEACVERALRDPATAGYAGQTAALLILVAPTGKADAALEDGDLDATPFAHCLRRAVQKMRFPQFKGEEVGARILLQLGSAN